jgi:hypothetical protein
MATKKTAPPKINVTATITLYTKTRNERLALDEQSKKLKVEEDNLLDLLTAAKVAPGDYGPYHLAIKTKKVPRCTDWPNFHAYLKATGNFDMLHKRLTETAVMARLDNGEYVPGVTTDDKVSYTITVA